MSIKKRQRATTILASIYQKFWCGFNEKTSKDDAEKFLKENNVPYKELLTEEEYRDEKPKFNACIIPNNNVVVLRDDWTWAMNDLVDKLYDDGNKPPQKSEQEKMDDKFKDYKDWAEKANAARKKSSADNVGIG